MKKKLIMGSALTILMCSSLITGATMALFTSRTEAGISVSGGKVDVSAQIKSLTTYSEGEPTENNGEFALGGTATVEGGNITLANFMPMDKVVVEIEVTNTSSVAYQQRVSLSGNDDGGFMDELLIGISDDNISYTYYSNYVSEWEKKSATEQAEVTTMYISVELPEFVGSAWQGKTCEISLAIEAVQGNADISGTAVANKVFLVESQKELNTKIGSMASGETVVLCGGEENWKDVTVEYTSEVAKDITIRGYGVGNMTINAPYSTVHLYNNVTTLKVVAVAGQSLHIYGNVAETLTIESGRAVVEEGASVAVVNVAPADEATVKVEVADRAEVESIVVNTKTGATAEVVIAEEVTVPSLEIKGEGDVKLENNGNVGNTTVTTAEQLVEALGMEGATVKLDGDIGIAASVLQNAINYNGVKNFAIDLNGKTLTLTDGTLNIVGENITLRLFNGNLNAHNSRSTVASIMVGSSCGFGIENVNVSATGSFLYPCGDAAKVDVTDCKLEIGGVYAVATNAAKTDNYNVVITVVGSSIKMLGDDSAAIMINVAGTLDMENVDIDARRQGIIVRAGEANLTNVRVNAEIPYLDWEYAKNYANNPASWGSGNEVPYGALVVGNQQESAYKADAVVKIEGGSYVCTAADDRVAERASALYTIKGTTRATTVTMSGATFTGKVVNYNNSATLEGFEDYTVITALVASAEEWAKIDDLVALKADEAYYFQQIADIEFTSQLAKFCGTYDGNGYDLTRAQNFGMGQMAAVILEIAGHTAIKNVDLYMYDPTIIISLADWGTAYGVDFENVTTNSKAGELKVNSSNFGFFISNALYTSTGSSVEYNFINCTNNVSIENAGNCTGVFVGSGPCANGTLIINYENCANNGDITGAAYVGYLYGNPSYIQSMTDEEYPDSTINVTNCVNNGVLRSNAENAVVAIAPKFSDVIANDAVTGTGSLIAENAIEDLVYTINQSDTDFTITTEKTEYTYKMAFSVNATYFTKDGTPWTEEHTADIPDRTLSEVSNGLKYFKNLTVSGEETGGLLAVKAYDKRTVVSENILTEEEVSALEFNAARYALTVKDGVTYMVFNVTEDYYINSGVVVMLYAYDAEGSLVGIKTVK